ncbi:tRNA (adenosine(37)-N6)-dimethylallyltransferase MiaA [Candidatus Liberibacter americanus]|uniref:tRNA dimethylallyltransferase n=1 Tax=Candidatus Liberibacter americanus str. Sao Paulo TaxID=1261131 RepID=U6B8A1_9HYPH|nr:tRNA (adenosine(37)-N6)-dimethylallyltransferase MiaA [Candidatus Liberibacter americanus]AHA28096.1 tRNA delta(2)-isopentenylpyrophosphate transferase [Candidatus Liberibacter americanus str. Sao Paulo]
MAKRAIMMFLSKNTKAIFITGPTASGKSFLSLDLARKFNGEIINADSMQVYDTIKILTSRPSDKDIQDINHYLYGHVSVRDTYSTGKWLRSVIKKIAEVQEKGCLPIIVGGTGLYFRALIGNFSTMPNIPINIRNDIREKLKKYGSHIMHDELSRIDPIASKKINNSDGHRIARALEIFMFSGKSITEFWKESSNPVIPVKHTYKIIILPKRCELKKRISKRFKQMLDTGAIDEVKNLMAMNLDPDLPIIKVIGVRHIISLLRGEISYEDTLEKGIIATNQYAKRQITWFNHQLNDDWHRISCVYDII